MPPQHPLPRRHVRRWMNALPALAGQALIALAGSTHAAAPDLHAPLLLLGEVHDNAALHALRLQALTRLVAGGARPALLMEQFDRERQADIDRALQRAPGMPPGDAESAATVDALIKLGSTTGGAWPWEFYRPVLKLALQYSLPIVAANVSRAEARRVIQLGLGPTGYQPDVPADINTAQASEIEASHCGQVDAGMAARLANAQVARDQFMAGQIKAFAGRGAVLLAGNGHVRTDIGVPRWLSPELRALSHVVGYLETGELPGQPGAAPFDETIHAAPQPRSDPCAGMPPVTTRPGPPP